MFSLKEKEGTKSR